MLLAGCAGGEDERAAERPAAGTTTTAPPESEPARETAFAVYFLRGELIGAGTRAAATEAVGAAAVRALLEGPTDGERAAGLASEIPAGTRLLALGIDGGLAVVDLSGEFASGGGSLSMRARIAQVVYTLTQFPTVGRVAFRLDGRTVEAIGGEGVAVDPPLTRADFEDLTPPILVEFPGPDDEVGSPLRFRGTANTFEATFMASVVAEDGTVLAEDFVTATSGSGDRGTFDASLSFSAEADAVRLVVYERSANDGSRINQVEIPLRIAE